MNMNRRKTDPKPTEIIKPNIIISLLSAGFYMGLLVGGGLVFNIIIQAKYESKTVEVRRSLFTQPEEVTHD